MENTQVIYVWQYYKTVEAIEKEIKMYEDMRDNGIFDDVKGKEEALATFEKIIKTLNEEKEAGGSWQNMEGKTSYKYIKDQREFHIRDKAFEGKYTYNNTRIVKGLVDKNAKYWLGYKQIDW